jgi:protein SCO1/2
MSACRHALLHRTPAAAAGRAVWHAAAHARAPLRPAALLRPLVPVAPRRGLSGTPGASGPAGGGGGGGGGATRRGTPIGWISLGLTTLSAGALYALYRQQLELKLRNAKTVGTASLGGPFALTSARGEPVTDADLRGGFALLYFGFTRCPDICPDELEKLSDVTRRLDASLALSPPITPVFITIDPARDTVARLAAYFGHAPAGGARVAPAAAGAIPDASPYAYHPRLLALTGEPAAIESVCHSYRIYSSKPSADEVASGEYLLDHSIIIYLLAPDGTFLSFYGRNFTAAEVADKAAAEIARWQAEHAPPTLFARLRGGLGALVGGA